MPNQPSYYVRPHLSTAKRLVCLVCGHADKADEIIAAALRTLIRTDDIHDPDTLVLCFYGLLVRALTDLQSNKKTIKLVGALPSTSEGAAVALLTLDFADRLAFILESVMGFSAEDAAFISSVQPGIHTDSHRRATEALEKIIK